MDKDAIKIYLPKFFLRWAHAFRVRLNPIYADENYKTDIIIDLQLDNLIKIMEKWGCEINHPNQYSYPHQVASGHIYLNNGKQFHVRVCRHEKGLMLKAHIEWHGVTHPILHIMYANLDYEAGYRMLKRLIEKTGLKILIDKGDGVYNSVKPAVLKKSE
jgi:hypothetical protein